MSAGGKSKEPLRTFTTNEEEIYLFGLWPFDAAGDISVVSFRQTAKNLYKKIIVGQCYRIVAYRTEQRNPALNTTARKKKLHLANVSLNRILHAKNLLRTYALPTRRN